MITDEYGVGTLILEGDEREHVCVQFGDGMTRIFTEVWDRQNVGIKMGRIVDDVPPFSACDYGPDSPPPKTSGTEVHLLFDNVKSIDAVIRQLSYVRDIMTGDVGLPSE